MQPLWLFARQSGSARSFDRSNTRRFPAFSTQRWCLHKAAQHMNDRSGMLSQPQFASATVERLLSELAAKQATVDTLLEGFAFVDFPAVAGLAFDVLYQPAAAIEQLGGDWYDIFVLPDGRIAFSLGDGCRRGPRPA